MHERSAIVIRRFLPLRESFERIDLRARHVHIFHYLEGPTKKKGQERETSRGAQIN